MENLERAKEKYHEALSILLKARKSNIRLKNYNLATYTWRDRLLAILKLGIAKCLLWQGRLTEAEIYDRETLSYYDKTLPQSFIVLSQIFFEQGRYEDSEITSRIALNMIIRNRVPFSGFIAENSLIRAKARQSLAMALLEMGRYKDAINHLDLVRKELRTIPSTYKRLFEGTVERGLALLFVGRTGEALQQFKIAKAKFKKRFGNEHYCTIETDAFRALCEYTLGNKAYALKLLDQIIPELFKKLNDRSGRSINQNENYHHLKSIVETYL